MKQTLFIITILLCNAVNSFACTCGEISPISKSDYESAGDVFIGRVIKVVEDKGNLRKAITFEVIKQLKITQQKTEVTIWSPQGIGGCGLQVKAGDKWYIFANKNSNNELYAELCGRSTIISKTFRGKGYGIKYRYLVKRAWRMDYKRYKKEKRFIRKINKKMPKDALK